MKSLQYYIVFSFLFAGFFSSSLATSGHTHESFLHCLSLHFKNSSITKVSYTENDSSYTSVLELSMHNRRFSTPTTPRPTVIVTPFHASEIQATISCSRKHALQIRIRSGGHDFEGLSYVSHVPFLIIDLINFRSVDIDVKNKVAWVQSGAILGELYYRIAEKSKTLAFPGSLCHTVGVGGYFSGGGYGLLFRKYGLAADNIIDAQFIDANGRILYRKAMGEDLFWAIRGGGGGSFGLVIAWKIKLVSVPATVTGVLIDRTLEQNAIKLLHRWQYIAPKLPNTVYSFASLRSVNSSQDGKRKAIVSFALYYLGRANELLSLMQEKFPELGLVKEDCKEMSWIQSIIYFGYIQNRTLDVLLDRTFQTPLFSPSFKSKSDYVKEPIPEIALEGLCSKLYEKEAEAAGILFVAYGGIMNEIPETATPYPHRTGYLYKIVYTVGWQKEDNINTDKYISWSRRVYSYMSSFVTKSPRAAYVNYRDLDIGINNNEGNTSYGQGSVWGRKYFGNNFDKLVKVKTMIDPENFFRHEQSIPLLSN